MSDNTTNDANLDELLSALQPSSANAAFRGELLTHTTGLLRRRRRLRRAGLCVALTGCYLAGLGTMYFAGGAVESAEVERRSLRNRQSSELMTGNIPAKRNAPTIRSRRPKSDNNGSPRPKLWCNAAGNSGNSSHGLKSYGGWETVICRTTTTRKQPCAVTAWPSALPRLKKSP